MQKKTRGQTALEYILIIAGIVVLVMVVILAVSGTVILGPQNGILNNMNYINPVK